MGSGPKPYPVVYDTDNGLQYTFETGNIAIPSAADGITALTGDVSATGPGSAAATISNATVTGKLLTGYSSGAGTVAGTDSILQAINKLNGNDALKLPLAGGTVTGLVTFQKPPTLPVHTFTSANSPITADASITSTVEVAVDGALTINGPSNPIDGQRMIFRLAQDNTGHAVTFATGAGNFEFLNGLSSFTAAGANGLDYVAAIYDLARGKWGIVAVTSSVVSSVHSDSNANIIGAVQLVSGTNVTLSQSGQAITINASGGGSSVTNPFYQSINNGSGTTITGDTNYHATGLTGSFTLSNASHKVKISFCGDLELSAGSWFLILTVFRDSTNLSPNVSGCEGVTVAYGGVTATVALFSSTGFIVDAPGDTSAHTYTIQGRVTSGTAVGSFGANSRYSMLIEEIIA